MVVSTASLLRKLVEDSGQEPRAFIVRMADAAKHPMPASVNLLIDRMLDKMSNASRLVEKLRQKNLVERTTSETDRRQVDVILTEEGFAILEKIEHDFDVLEETFKKLSEEEVIFLNKILDKVRG